MKRLFFSLLILLATASAGSAQINVNVNLGAQPQWGPAGYDRAEYYYLPDIETYYYIPKKQFIYQQNGKWVFVNSLPARYSSYNLYNGYKVVLNRPTPYLQFDDDRVKYVGYKNKKGSQITIKQKKAKTNQGRAFASSNQGNAKSAAKAHGNGNNGNGKGKGKGNGKH